MGETDIHWELAHFTALTPAKLQRIHAGRQEVFVVEQNCAYLDADQYDEVCHHLMGWRSVGDALVMAAYLRIKPPGNKYAEPSLGRVITTKIGRGQGLGRELIRRGLAAAQELYPDHGNRISAQHYLEQFYQSFGFVTVSGIYDEDGIPHVEMLYSPAQQLKKVIA